MQVRGKSVSYIHREFSNKSNAERILKISSHLPKCGIVFTGTPCRISALCKCRNNTKALKRTQTYHKASLLYCSETAGPIELHLETGLALTNAMLLDAGGWGGGSEIPTTRGTLCRNYTATQRKVDHRAICEHNLRKLFAQQ